MPTVDTGSSSLPPSPNQTDDVYDDDDEDKDPHAALVDHVRSDNHNNREALAYLLRYETMVRQQEAEDMATLAHLRPCLERLKELLPEEQNEEKKQQITEQPHSDEEIWTKEISYASLRKALEVLEMQGPAEFMTTDRQLMMILRLLTQSTPSDHRRSATDKATLTWAELVQCYKTCIVGMTTLQHLPHQDEMRQRARDRTLAMLALFEPQSRLWSSPLTPVRSMANTSALNPTPRSSFAPPRAVKRRRVRRTWLLATACLAVLVAGVYFVNMEKPQRELPGENYYIQGATSKPHGVGGGRGPTRSAPMFTVQSRVPTTTTSKTVPSTTNYPPPPVEIYEESDEDYGVTGPALLVATVGAPLLVTVVQSVLVKMNSGAAFVATAAPVSAFGSGLVTAAGIISLASLLFRSFRALGRGLAQKRIKQEDE